MTGILPGASPAGPVNHADLGGQRGHGAVTPEAEGDLWHAGWEPRVLALTLAMGGTGQWNIDQSRRARETLPAYAALSYYAIWFEALLVLLAERGLVAADELAAGRALHASPPLARVPDAAAWPALLARGAPTQRPAAGAPRFAVGDRVLTRAAGVPHHTRLPAYARGHTGTVAALHGAHVYPDSHAAGTGEQPQWLYTVVFDGAELWGADSTAGQVSVDAFEPYLEPAHG